MNKRFRQFSISWFPILLLLWGSGCDRPPISESRPNSETQLTSNGNPVETSQESADGCCGNCGGATAETNGSDCGNCESCEAGSKDQSNSHPDGKSNEPRDPADTKSKSGTGTQKRSDDKKPNSRAEDREIFHFLLQNHKQLTRKVTKLENGVVTVTESSDPEIARKIQVHVASMHSRIEDRRPVRMWDSLYREVFANTGKIEMTLEKTEKGIKVTETSKDPYVVKLIQSHAEVVSGFVKNGFEEAQKNHEPPGK